MSRDLVHKKWFLLLACLMGMQAYVCAQSFSTKIYTTSDGLPDAFVNSIYQDSKGYIWLGTRTSLCRFDGLRFENYGKYLDSSSFTGSVVLEDRLHRFWIYTRDGLGLLQHKKLRYFPGSDGLKIGWLFSVTQLSDGRIWMLSDKGIYQFEDSLWRKLNLIKEYKDLPCRFAVEGPNGIYLSYGWQLFLYRKDGTIKPITPKQTQYPYYVWLKKYNGQVYVNTVEGMYKIVNDGLVRLFERQIHGIYSYDFLVDAKKRMWISTEKYGLLVSDPGNEQELRHTIQLPFNQTLLFMQDQEGNVWASNYEGLLKVKDAYLEVFHPAQHSLLEDIRHLTRKPNGDILIKSAANGFISHRENKFIEDPEFALANTSLRHTVVDASASDAQGNLWIVTREGNLYRINSTGIENINQSLKEESFTDLAYDSSNQTMYACGKKLYAVHNGKFTELAANSGITSAQHIYRNRQHTIVYTSDSGVYGINAQGLVRKLGLIPASGFHGDFQLFNDPEGGFWTSSLTEGLQKWEWNSADEPVRQVSLTVNDGLPNNFVVAVTFDAQHRMWVATLSGLVVIQKNPSGTYTVNRVDEPASFHINNWGEARLTTDREGAVWLSSFHELIRFQTGQVYFDQSVPKIAIHEVLLNLKRTDWRQWTDSLDNTRQVPAFVRLPHDQNTISISFDAITYSNNEQSLFSYQLQGIDTGWRTPTDIRSVSFANLPPGNYLFRVKTRKPNTAWSPEARFSFVIREPFWATWWFQFLLILCTAATIALFVWLRIRRIKNKAVLQQQIQALDLKALKAANALMGARQKMTDAEMQALRAQMNPHFIYNALNSIQSLVLDGRTQEAIRYIGKFAKLLRQVLEHSDNNMITLEKELSTLELYIQLEVLRMNAVLDYRIEMDEQLMPEKELVPPLIIQPYVENALWHGLSHKAGARKLRIIVSASEEWLFITIRDNGIGRRQAALNKKERGPEVTSKGMGITANRLALINEGTTEEAVHVLDLYNEENEAMGTEVTLRLARTTKA